MTGSLTVKVVIVAVFAMGLSGCGPSAADQAATEKTIAEIQKMGGKVTRDERNPSKPVISVSFVKASVTDAGLEHLTGLPRLQTLSLSRCWDVTDAGRVHLKRLTQLRSLDLSGTKATGAALEHLKDMARLQKLDLSGCDNVADAGLEHLRGLTRLRSLNLAGTTVTEAGVTKLKKALPSLGHLSLRSKG